MNRKLPRDMTAGGIVISHHEYCAGCGKPVQTSPGIPSDSPMRLTGKSPYKAPYCELAYRTPDGRWFGPECKKSVGA